MRRRIRKESLLRLWRRPLEESSLAIPRKATATKAISVADKCRLHIPGRSRKLEVHFRATTRRQEIEEIEAASTCAGREIIDGLAWSEHMVQR